MKVEQLMKHPVKTCQPEDSLEVAARMMWDADCGCLPVVDAEGRAVAMITDRDICMAAHFQGAALRSLKVRDSMSKALHACTAGESVADAEHRMRVNRVRRLPIVNTDRRVVGILSLTDVAVEANAERRIKSKQISLADVGETLAAICTPRALAMTASA